ncbi:hypothetical protein EJ02DRAFT_455475 [Clathrospora elynae]|uniref:Uncharacterized protein n=1 Tax=Clathrospora elynae TaxID=706981 RepID=A0A6A5SR12_9PLEO|nr:hypothetical protein EJ02DRAFT_455475 [Clathrospora elynae]
MLLPPGSAPGFGTIDPRFYKQKKRKEDKEGDKRVWNEDVQKAISGDIQRHLAKIRGLGGVEVKIGDHGEGMNGAKREDGKMKDTVTIPLPPIWGTFVIKAEDGRVIIVDKDGEYDSGPQKSPSERQALWVKAASTIEPPTPSSQTEFSIPPPPPKHRTSSHSSKERTKDHDPSKGKYKEKGRKQRSHKHKRSHHSHLTLPLKPLTPIQESEYEDGYLPSGGEGVLSPTNFIMTGAASGWPSRTATSVASPVVGVSGGYEYVVPESSVRSVSEGYGYVISESSARSVSGGYEYVVPDSPLKSKTISPVRSPPGAWPSPPLSPSKSTTVSEQPWNTGKYKDAWKGDGSNRSRINEKSHRTSKSEKLRGSRKDSDAASVKSHSTYRAPTVEDASNTSSEEKEPYAATGWGGSVKSSIAKGWGEKGSDKSWSGSKKTNSDGSAKPIYPHSSGSGSENWSDRTKAADNPSWTGIQPYSSHSRHQSPGVTSPVSQSTWDGYERVKTVSNVSVAGTGSERSALASQVSSQPSTHRSHRSHASHRSNRHGDRSGGQTGWAGSQANHRSRSSPKVEDHTGWAGSQASWSSDKARVDDNGWEASGQGPTEYVRWEGSKHGSERGWRASKAGSDGGGGASKYANGFDESNETYLNENWGGVPVRVGSSPRKTGVVGWEDA